MKKSSLLFLLLSLTTFMFAQQRPTSRPVKVTKPAIDATYPSGKIIGSVFSDYFYIVNEPQADPTKGTNGRNEFDIRRAHLGYEYLYNRDLTGRVVLDASDGANPVREANIKWENFIPMHFFAIGMMQSPAERTEERIWGYRSLDAMGLQRYGLVQEFDMGLEFGGKFNPQGSAYYSLAVTNGNGILAESDKQKKFSALLGFMPDRMSVIEVYVDFEDVPAGRGPINGKIFYGMETRMFAFGVEAFYRMNRKFAGTNDVTPAGASLFSWFEMTKGLRGVIRVDGADDDLKTSDLGYRQVYANAGLDITPVPEVHIIPNVRYVKNLEKGNSPKLAEYIEARITAALYFPTLN